MSTPDPVVTYYPPADATPPGWYGRKASTAPMPESFIRAICTRRADGMRSLTPPTGGTQDHPALEALAGLAALAALAVSLWWWLR